MSKLAPSAQATFCAALVDELVRGGVRHAIVCPGSRSTPLALALASHGRLAVHVRLDERSAGFMAVGIGLATSMPAVLLTTSGTAATEIHAAVVEAHQAKVPLLVCTADRPVELHGVGAPQTISQAGLFAGSVRFACDFGVPDAAAADTWRSVGARLLAEALHSPAGPGPVHLNLAFRDPLDAGPGELPPAREDGRPWHAVAPPLPSSDHGLVELLAAAERPLFVAGAGSGSPALLRRTAAAWGIPLLADPRSGCRNLDDSIDAPVVSAADSLLRVPRFADGHAPDVVVRFGEAWASKVVSSWLTVTARAGASHVLVDPCGEWRDPAHEVGTIVRSRPDDLLRGLLEAGRAPSMADDWAPSWQLAEERAQTAIAACLGTEATEGHLTEPGVARALATRGEIGTIVVSSSMPVRDLEWFSAPRKGYPAVLANRGANGIDGVVSTTIGVAAGRVGPSAGREGEGPVIGLVGDLAFLHDLSALVRPAGGTGVGFGSGHPCGIVVIDNSGGGIFSYLPQASTVAPGRFEQLFATPQAADVAALARAAGCVVTEAPGATELEPGLDEFLATVSAGGSGVLVCRTDRSSSVGVHDRLNEAVARALDL